MVRETRSTIIVYYNIYTILLLKSATFIQPSRSHSINKKHLFTRKKISLFQYGCFILPDKDTQLNNKNLTTRLQWVQKKTDI